METPALEYSCTAPKIERRQQCRERRIAGAESVEALVVDGDIDAVIADISQAQRALVADRLLDAEAPLLVRRRVEGADLAAEDRGTEGRSQLRLQAVEGRAVGKADS